MSATDQHAPPPPALRRTLATWAAVSLSVAAMGASLAVNLNPQGSAATVGRAVPLTFLLATAGVLLVAYGFARVCSRLAHSGSVFGLTGVTIGPRAGVVAGWGLLGAYLAFIITTATTAGIFGADFLRVLGLYHTTPGYAPWIIALIAVAISLVLGIFPVKSSMKTLLWIEICTTLLIVIIGVVVVIRVAGGHAPAHQSFTLNMFTVPHGVSINTLFLGIVFGFLSFAGFEASAALGEETADPKRAIPRAIFGVALFGGVFYTLGTAVEMLGFGTSTSGVTAFSSSASLFGTLGQEYVTAAVGNIVTLGTTISAIGCCLATTVAASRLLFAMNRGSMKENRLSRVSARSGAPVGATFLVTGLAAVLIVITWLFITHTVFDLFAASGTIGTLSLLVAYGLFSAGAWYYLCIRSPRRGIRANRLDYVVPLLAIAVIAYTMYRNVSPWPSAAAGRADIIIAGVWVLAGIALIVALPRTARRIASSLSHDEGLAEAAYLGQAIEGYDELTHHHHGAHVSEESPALKEDPAS
jgi:amino acid transporter